MQRFDLAKLAAVAVLAGIATPSALRSDRPAARIDKIELSSVPLISNPDLEGVSNAMLTGSFDKPGLYVARATMAQSAIFPPHTHPDVRITHVVSGTMYLGEGDAFEDSLLVAYPAGTVAVTPPGKSHFMAARDGDFTVMEIGAGPSATEFVAN